MSSKKQSIPCHFFFEKGGCKKENCDYSHDPAVYNAKGSAPGPSFGGGHFSNRGGGFGSQPGGGFRGGRGGGFGGGRGGKPYSGNNNNNNNESNEYPGHGGPGSGGPSYRGRGGFKPRAPMSNYDKKPKPQGGPEKPAKVSCKFFRQGSCKDGNSCKFRHCWTDADDVGLFYLRSFGEENLRNDEFEIRDVCVLDSSQKMVAFAQPKGILIVDLNSATKDFQMKPMAENEELTCMKYFEQALILGVYDNIKKCSLIKIVRSDGNEIKIDPAHIDYIVDICNIRDFIVTASLDEKIKFWRWNQNILTFEVALTHTHKEMSKIMYLAYNGFDSLFVANGDYSLSIFTLDYSNGSVTLNLVMNFDGYHKDTITNIKVFNFGQKIHVVTSSFDQTVQFFSMDEGKPVHQQQFQQPISSMDIVANSKDKDILVLGCANGNVELYELNQNFQEVGKLIIHKMSLISNVMGFSEKKNDVSFNYLIVTDTAGRVSTWQFQKEKK